MNKVKLIITINPSNKDNIKELIINGVDVVRLNMSYATHDFCEEVVNEVNKVNKELSTNVSIMFDLNGPRLKMGRFVGGNAFFKEHDKIRIYTDEIIGDNTKLCINYFGLTSDVDNDSIIKLNDGNVILKALEKGDNYIICEVIKEGTVFDYGSVNIPDVELSIPFLPSKDIKDIEFANKLDIDYLALSFVKSSENVMSINDMLIELGNDHMEIISKIECSNAVEDMDQIIKMSDGIMIARSDLSLEIPMERVPSIQKLVIDKCNKLGKVSIVSNDILARNFDINAPTSVSDIVNAVLDGIDAISLTGNIVTNPVPAVKTIEKIVKEAELNIDYLDLFDKASRTEDSDVTGMIACNVAVTADKLNCKAIIIPTVTGYTARKISRFRPLCPIIAVSPNIDTVKSLSYRFGITAVQIDELNSLDKIIKTSKKLANDLLSLEENDKIIITGGYPFKETKNTNFMKIEEL